MSFFMIGVFFKKFLQSTILKNAFLFFYLIRFCRVDNRTFSNLSFQQTWRFSIKDKNVQFLVWWGGIDGKRTSITPFHWQKLQKLGPLTSCLLYSKRGMFTSLRHSNVTFVWATPLKYIGIKFDFLWHYGSLFRQFFLTKNVLKIGLMFFWNWQQEQYISFSPQLLARYPPSVCCYPLGFFKAF